MLESIYSVAILAESKQLTWICKDTLKQSISLDSLMHATYVERLPGQEQHLFAGLNIQGGLSN